MEVISPRTYRPDELADMLRVTERAIYLWIKQGRIKALKVGSCTRISHEEYRKILASGVPRAPEL